MAGGGVVAGVASFLAGCTEGMEVAGAGLGVGASLNPCCATGGGVRGGIPTEGARITAGGGVDVGWATAGFLTSAGVTTGRFFASSFSRCSCSICDAVFTIAPVGSADFGVSGRAGDSSAVS